MSKEEFLTYGLNNPDAVDELTKALKATSRSDHRYDLNFSLSVGKGGENLVEKILSGAYTVEVKRDFRIGDTGKVLVEYGAAYSDKPSGILISEADWYAFVFAGKFNDEVVVLIKRTRLLELIDRFGKTHPSSGTNGLPHFLLLNKEELLSL